MEGKKLGGGGGAEAVEKCDLERIQKTEIPEEWPATGVGVRRIQNLVLSASPAVVQRQH